MRKVKCPYGDTKKTYSSAHSLRHHVVMNHSVGGSDMVKAIVKKIVLIPDGAHIGTISELELRKTEEYGDYLDMSVKVSDVPDSQPLSFGMPLNVSIMSDLGKLLMALGYNVAKHETEQVDLDKEILGKPITFVTYTQEVERDGKKLKFARIVKDSLMLADQPHKK